MSHTPHPPPVANPLVLVLTGSRAEAVAWEDTLQRYCNAGLRRLANAPVADPAAALETLADCAPRAFTRYNEDYHLTPTLGTLLDEV